MAESRPHTDDLFEFLLRERITDAVIGCVARKIRTDGELIARLRRFEHRARTERLSSQTLQVISSARRLLGDAPDPRHGAFDAAASGPT
ncbi:hypothetical protein [Methylobacterium sp. ID0610]|uniref:hypothetical protein n=1 Tax=Methylobacterium carpenticola TaxID=3344827 RepID=UPI00367C9095